MSPEEERWIEIVLEEGRRAAAPRTRPLPPAHPRRKPRCPNGDCPQNRDADLAVRRYAGANGRSE